MHGWQEWHVEIPMV